jgi:nucleoside-diphosphate-sugar epimerase
MSTILVTGGAGYLGSVLVPHLLGLGHEITVLDNLMYDAGSLDGVAAHAKFRFVRGDARDEATLKRLVARADIVIPLAAIVGAPACDADPDAAVTTNRDAVAMLVKLLGREQIVVMPVTNSGYGIGETGIECTEETPLRPISLYGRTKVHAEDIVLSRGNGISLRLATVFGMSPRMRLDLLVNDFVHAALTKSELVLFESHFKRNYLHISDVARAFVHAIEHFETMKDEAYNAGLSDANLSKWELCERIRRQVPAFTFSEAPIGEDPDQRNYIVSNAKIEATGFLPATSLDEGIAELVAGLPMLPEGDYRNA